MKKLLKLLLSVVLVLQICTVMVWSAAPSGGSADDTKGTGPVGFWKMCEITSNGQTVGKDQLEMYEKLGTVIYMEIREDGTVSVSGIRETDMTGTWDETSLVMEGEKMPYKLDGDIFSLEDEGGDSMKFERSTKEAIYKVLGYKEGVLDESVEYSKEEETLVDKEEFSAKITGYQADMTGFTVKVKCENKSDNKLLFGVDDCVLNKYVINPSWALSLEAGESKEAEIKFKPVEIARCGISAVDELVFSMQLTNGETWKRLFEKELVTVYPTGKKAEDIKAPDRVPVDGEVVVTDDENCLFVLQSAGEDPALGYVVNCYFENRTDRTLTFTWKNTSLDGQEVTCIYAKEVLPGARGYNRAYFMSKTLEDKGISAAEIKEVGGTLRVYGATDGLHETILEKEFTYKP